MSKAPGEYISNPEHQDFKALVDQAYQLAEKILIQREIQPAAFYKEYGGAQIQHDEQYVRDREKRFAEEDDGDPETAEQRKIGKIMEAFFYDQVAQNSYMGENTRIEKTSKYDDIASGVDFVTEHADQGQLHHMALAIDATSGHAGSKLSRMLQAVQRGENFAFVKYFKHGKKVGLENIPKVMIGISSEKVLTELMRHWVNGDKEKLRNHPAQTYFLAQIYSQLEGLRVYYEEEQKKPETAAIYARYTKIIAPILRKKFKEMPHSELMEVDNSLSRIRERMTVLNSEYLKQEGRKRTW